MNFSKNGLEKKSLKIFSFFYFNKETLGVSGWLQSLKTRNKILLILKKSKFERGEV